MGWLDVLGDLGSTYMTSQSAKKGAKQQTQALNKSNDLTWQMYQQTRTDNAPARALGNNAIARLSRGFGWTSFNPVKAAQQDVIPAKISVPEAMVLKNLGGAGVQDPRTGFYHFYDPDSRDGGNDWGGDGGSDPDNDPGPSNDRNDARDSGWARAGAGLNYDNRTPMEKAAAAQRATDFQSRVDRGEVSRDTGWQDVNSNSWNDPENPAYQRGAVPGFAESVPSQQKGSIAAALGAGIAGFGAGTYLGGPTTGMSTAGKAARAAWDATKTARSGLGNTSGWNSLEGVRSPSMTSRESRGGDGGTGATWGNTFGTYSAPAVTAYGTTPTDEELANYYGGYTSTGNVLGDFEQDFGAANLYDDPSYQWRVSEALRGLDKSAAAKGTLFSGQYIKDLSDYISGQASTEYNNAWNRFQTNRGNKYNMLASMAGMGQAATGNVNAAGLNTAANMGANYAGIGNANALGTFGQANAWTGLLNNNLNSWDLASLLNR